jgi:hypothetical protein
MDGYYSRMLNEENINFDYSYNKEGTIAGSVTLCLGQTDTKEYYAVSGCDYFFGLVFQTKNGWMPYYGPDENCDENFEQENFGANVRTLEEAVNLLLQEGNGSKIIGNPYVIIRTATKATLPRI